MLPGTEDRHKLLLYQSGSFRREVEALFSLLPAMKRFTEEKNAEVIITVPTIVYGAYDDQGLGVVALMDLNDSGNSHRRDQNQWQGHWCQHLQTKNEITHSSNSVQSLVSPCRFSPTESLQRVQPGTDPDGGGETGWIPRSWISHDYERKRGKRCQQIQR